MREQLKRQDAVSLSARLAMQFPGNEQVIESVSLAAFAHDGAFRKESRRGVEYRDPFIIHPLRNALRVQRWYAGWNCPRLSDMVCAALLHDTVEDAAERIIDFYGDMFFQHGDTPRETAFNVLARKFGDGVSDTVIRLTNPEDVRSHEDYAEHLRVWVVTDERAYVTKAADLVDNAGSLKHMDASPRRERLARKYVVPVQLLLAHSEVVSAVGPRSRIEDRLRRVEADLSAILGVEPLVR